jgi:general secretion pathway protein D
MVAVLCLWAVHLMLPIAVYSQTPETRAAINVKDADISTILKVFSKRTKRNFILDERVKGTVTMFIPGELAPDDSQRILDTVLALKGFTTVPVGENLWKVVPSKEARQSTIPILSKGSLDSSNSGSVVTELLRLKYVTAKDVQPLLSQLISADGLISAYEGANSLILIDYRDNIKRLTKLVRALDIPFNDQEMTIIPISHADANDVAEKLKELLGGEEEQDLLNQNSLMSRIARRRASGLPQNSAPNGIVGEASGVNISPRSKPPKIIADERTNSVIVVADEEMTTRIRGLVEELDSQVDRSGNRFYVYRCQHANAEDLAEVLSGLVGGGVNTSSQTGSSSTMSNRNDSSDGLSGRSSRSNRTQGRLSRTSRTPGQSRQNTDSSGTVSAQLGEDVSITADPSTNSLVINSGRTDYEKIFSLLQELDIKRRQVLVEAMILEVGVDSAAVLGTDFTSSTGGADGGLLAQSNFGGNSGLTGLLSNPTSISGFSVAAASAGTISLPGNLIIPSQAILVNAARSNTNVNVLSAPTLLATDNEEAEIVVGQNVPFLASTSTNDVNLNNTFNQIDRQDVGITLRITPQINSNDFVTLRIFTDVSAVIKSADASLGPTTTVRSSETTVITKDSQMIVIGGLMADTVNDADSGVPFLMDIPIFGDLFRRSTDRRQRTNLLTFITPRIVRDQYDARDATIAQKKDTERVIKEYGHQPSRDEILQSQDMNKVVELQKAPDKLPGTILPPKQSGTSDNTVQGKIKSSSSENRASKERVQLEETINLAVEPTLPEVSAAGRVLEKREPSSQPNGNYVVCRFSRFPQKLKEQLPFLPSSEQAFGLRIPRGSAPEIARFFSQSHTLGYKLGGKTYPVEVLGSYASQDDATTAYSLKTQNWHTLSPFEAMNLGKFPWVSSD